jgi:hypothetical protein
VRGPVLGVAGPPWRCRRGSSRRGLVVVGRFVSLDQADVQAR